MNDILVDVGEMNEVGDLFHAQNTLLQEEHDDLLEQNQTNEKIGITSRVEANPHPPLLSGDVGSRGEDAREVISKKLRPEESARGIRSETSNR
ncbi:hypothetical protein ACFX16_009709 [Malus domestica]